MVNHRTTPRNRGASKRTQQAFAKGEAFMPELRDVVVTSPVGFHKFAEASSATLEELRGTLTLLTDVHVFMPLVMHDEYAITSRASGQTIHATYAGPDHASPGALVFHAVARRGRRGSRRT
jgi:hypothetical protein